MNGAGIDAESIPAARVGAGGGGMFGGPPLGFGIGCCWSGVVRPVPEGSFGSTSSHSEDKSPELNLKK